MTSPGDLWAGFTHDPRDPANAALRASDLDRNIVHQVLAEAYADGRLDRDEFDVRTEQTGSSRTLGELPALVTDLLPAAGSGALPATRDTGSLQARAERKYRSDVSGAFGAFLVPSIVCFAIWAATMYGGFFWPGIVMALTGARFLGVVIGRQAAIDAEVHRLEKKQARQLGARPAPDEDEDKE